MSQVANNVYFDGGKLRSIRGILDVASVPNNTQSLHFLNPTDGWLLKEKRTWFVRPFLPADQFQMTYMTDGEWPRFKIAGNSAEYDLGLERPLAPSLTTFDLGDVSNPLLVRDQSYIVCWVDGFGRVGPTSPASISVTVGEGALVRVSRPALPSGQWRTPGAVWRIFRSNETSGGEGVFQFVDEIPITTTHYDDTREPDELTYIAFSDLWEAPPDGLKGLTLAPNNFLVGFVGNEVLMSEPQVPQAWPYSWGFQEQVRGVAVIQGGILVVTDGQPWLLAGSDPNNIQKIPIESNAVCLSTDSLVDMGSVAVFAGKDGLYAAQGNTVINATEAFFDEETWQSFDPHSIRGFQHNGRYIGFYGNSTEGKGFVFDPVKQEFSTLSGMRVLAGSFEPWEERDAVLYYDGIDLRRGWFDEGDLLTGRWKSREILYPAALNFATFRTEANLFPFECSVWSDGVLDYREVEDNKLYKLTTGFKAKIWEIEVEGVLDIDLLALSTATGGTM